MISHEMVAGVDNRDNPHVSFPERQLGFKAWRRKEILDFAKSYEDVIGKVDENTAKDDLIKLMESFKMQGKFVAPPDQARDKEIESLKERLMALEANAAPKDAKKKAD